LTWITQRESALANGELPHWDSPGAKYWFSFSTANTLLIVGADPFVVFRDRDHANA
jgi:hypothetical protein